MSNAITIIIASNGFMVEVNGKTQIFGTTDSLLSWLKDNLPTFTPTVEPIKRTHDG